MLLFSPERCLADPGILKVDAYLIKDADCKPAHICELEVSHKTHLGV